VLAKIVNKFYDACNSTQEQLPEQAGEVEKKAGVPEQQPSSSAVEERKERPKQIEEVVEYQVDTSLGRTPLNVVKRISNLLAMKDKDLNDYKNTELQKLWMPDSKSIDCYDCNLKFNTFRRKHHCRLCGQIFCSKCCSTLVPGKIIMVTGELRVCNYCSKVVLSYIKSPDIAQDLKSDLQALEEDLSNKFVTTPDASSTSSGSTTRSPYRKASVGYQEERLVSSTTNALSNADRKNILQQSHSLKSLYEDMIKTLNHHIKGSELVSYLISSQKCGNKQQAHEILNAMVEGAFILPIITEVDGVENSFPADFSENFVYRLSKIEEIGISGMRPDSISEGPEIDEIMPPSINSENFYYSEQDQELASSIMSTAGSKPHLGEFLVLFWFQ
jgi:1-phosphatidylinositol-3-phosphate 5-kinase